MALRERILDAVTNGDGSPAQIAGRFRVAVNTVYNLLRLREETGALRPRPNPGGHKPAIGPERYDEVRQLLAAQPDLTLEQLRDRLGVDCSQTAVCRTLKKLGLTVKKTRTAIFAEVVKRPGKFAAFSCGRSRFRAHPHLRCLVFSWTTIAGPGETQAAQSRLPVTCEASAALQ